MSILNLTKNQWKRQLQRSLCQETQGLSRSSRQAMLEASPQTAWLKGILEDSSPPPKLYAWSHKNLPGHHRAIINSPSPPLPPGPNHVHILGIGNLGRLYAVSLSRFSPNRQPAFEPRPPSITLVVHRKALLEKWAADPRIGLTWPSGCSEVCTNIDFNLEWWTEKKPQIGPVREVSHISNLIIATKAFDALPQADRLRRYLDGTSTVLFVQNGMNRLWPPSGDVYMRARFPDARQSQPNWVVSVTSHGVTSQGPFASTFLSPADIAIGVVLPNPLPENAQMAKRLITAICDSPPLNARLVTRPSLWVLQIEKLVVNSIINSLTAILRCKNGELFTATFDGLLAPLIDLLLHETSQVLQGLAQHPSTAEMVVHGNHDQNVAKHVQELVNRFSTASLRAMVYAVGEKVKNNTSSMLQDVTAGKRTEVRDFNGWLIDTAQSIGLSTSLENQQTLIHLVEKAVVVKDPTQLLRYFPSLKS